MFNHYRIKLLTMLNTDVWRSVLYGVLWAKSSVQPNYLIFDK